MANKKFWMGMLVMVLVFGMAVIGCSDGNGDDDGGINANVFAGTWNGTFEDENWNEIEGTITVAVSGMVITITSGTAGIPTSKSISLTSVEDVTQIYRVLLELFMPDLTLNRAVAGITSAGPYTILYDGDFIVLMEGRYQNQNLRTLDISIDGWGRFESE